MALHSARGSNPKRMSTLEEGSAENDDDFDSFNNNGSLHTSVTRTSTTPSKSASVVLSVTPATLQLVSEQHDEINNPENGTARKSPILCGCCDFLRACIVVDVLYICIVPLTLLMWIVRRNKLQALDELEASSDEIGEDDDNRAGNNLMSVRVLIVKNACEIAFAALGIVGAVRFSKYLVLATAVWFYVDVVLSAVYRRYPVAVLVAIVGSLHLVLGWALHKGQITRANYSRTEKYCCLGWKAQTLD